MQLGRRPLPVGLVDVVLEDGNEGIKNLKVLAVDGCIEGAKEAVTRGMTCEKE